MFVEINEPILLQYYYLLHSDYLSFYLRYHIKFTCVPLGFSWMWQFLRLSCFWMWFCRIPSTGICLMFFSWSDWIYDLLGRRPQLWSIFVHNIETYYQHDLSLLMLTLITWLKVGFVRFLHCRVTLSFLLFHSILCKSNPHSRSRELYSTSQ